MKARLLGLPLLLLTLLGQQAPACEKTVRWAEDPPYAMRLSDGRISGLNIELTQAVLARLGCRMQLVELPFARALQELESGRLDILPGVFDRPERRAYARFARPLMLGRNLMFVRREALASLPAEATLEGLLGGGWRLAAQPGVIYGPAFARAMAQPALAAQIDWVPLRPGMWQMLARGRVDAVIADEFTAQHELGSLQLLGQVAASPLVISAEPAGHAFSRRRVSAEFVQQFDAALQAYQADGSYAALLRRYGTQR